jgi:cathepsin A (carboxypeptidase C)
MFGLFLENGPLKVTQGKGLDDFKISPADKAWTDDYHVIFVDQPINTGFSYGKKSLTSMKEGADEFVKFIEMFYSKYPELSKNDFLLTGESYGGKYLPLFTHAILERNKKDVPFKIPLKATMIGDPFPSPITQRTNMHLIG